MKKILSLLLVGASSVSFACKVDLAKKPVICGGKSLNNTATYKDFQGCKSVISTPKKVKGMDGYKVSLTDDNGKDYNCFFNSNEANTIVKGCRD